MEEYRVQFEIAGPVAIFARPDCGAAFVSYPAPTHSAVKGMFECVAWFKSAFIRPTKVEICAPIQFQTYVTNYGGPLRKSNQLSKCSPYQLVATALVDVCYRVYGEVEAVTQGPQSINHLHALQEIFLRRLEKGQLYHTPFLGWKEFVPSYFGPLRPGTGVDESINQSLPSMLFSVFDKPTHGRRSPQFRQNVQIKKGVLEYA